MAKAGSAKPTEAEEVKEWMNKVDPESRTAINLVRKIIRAAGPKLTERIKWNAPSYYYKEDIVTFGPLKAKDRIILVFHHPRIVKIKSDLLQGNILKPHYTISVKFCFKNRFIKIKCFFCIVWKIQVCADTCHGLKIFGLFK